MVFSRFAIRLVIRLVVLFGLLAALALVVALTDFAAVALLLGVAAAAQTWHVVRYVNRTNDELTRFLDAIRYDDFTQSFSFGHLGDSFAGLRAAFEDVMSRFRETRSAREVERRYLETLVEHVPIAIISVDDDGRVSLLNNAARRLLDAAGALTLDALDRYGAAFQQDVRRSQAGDRCLSRTELDGVERQLILSTTQITIGGGARRLIALQDIQSELEATELSAWQDMVRVLSHEIGNSITPVASLARTADDMVVDLRKKIDDDEAAELISDIHDAIDTIWRRSEGLMRFVKSYRELVRMPPPNKQPIALASYFGRLERLLGPAWSDQGVTVHLSVPAEGLTITADEGLLDQAILNLMRNAADAAAAADEPQVWLGARLSERGRPIIEIADNGPGLDAELGERIFLPFFTTKAEGSGIGLSLARQVMLMHGGAITARPRDGGGALFQLSF